MSNVGFLSTFPMSTEKRKATLLLIDSENSFKRLHTDSLNYFLSGFLRSLTVLYSHNFKGHGQQHNLVKIKGQQKNLCK